MLKVSQRSVISFPPTRKKKKKPNEKKVRKSSTYQFSVARDWTKSRPALPSTTLELRPVSCGKDDWEQGLCFTTSLAEEEQYILPRLTALGEGSILFQCRFMGRGWLKLLLMKGMKQANLLEATLK
ncbi:hypothetical protein CEXT_218341 [Caerostris extrusa]|uniref:Uncharacterized protein n=1 Tax=Caerostris extrusa TaxID=172846 RepID=A0AAV4UIC2_CAEEX|nr:hypothetical protein CEXT_218341 [Caerostris extrusa]